MDVKCELAGNTDRLQRWVVNTGVMGGEVTFVVYLGNLWFYAGGGRMMPAKVPTMEDVYHLMKST